MKRKRRKSEELTKREKDGNERGWKKIMETRS